MTTWTRAEWDHICGGCGARLHRGQPMQVTTIVGMQRRPLRCVDCADGPPPPDLPPLPERIVESPRTKRMTSAKQVAARALPSDWKTKASGD